MQGSIEKRGRNSWRITVSLGKNPQTDKYEKYRETVTGTKTEAKKRMAEIIAQYQKGYTVNPDRITFAEYADLWLKDYANNNLAQKTIQGYKTIIDLHLKPAFGKTLLQKLKPAHLRNYYTETLEKGRKDNKKSKKKSLSKRTVLHHHRLIHKMLRDAVQWEYVGRNVADAVTPPQPESKEIAVLSESEIRRLQEAVKDHYFLPMPVILALHTGMRMGEILGLRWKDVDLKKKQLTINQVAQPIKGEDGKQYIVFKKPKTKTSRRTITLPNVTIKALTEHKNRQAKDRQDLQRKVVSMTALKDHGLVCCLQDGQPIIAGTLSTAFRKAAQSIGLSISFHGLRHCHASLLLKAGVHPKVVAERLGHSKIGITLDLYSHLMDGLQSEAAQKIDSMLGNKA